jgi:hypothetical protein
MDNLSVLEAWSEVVGVVLKRCYINYMASITSFRLASSRISNPLSGVTYKAERMKR